MITTRFHRAVNDERELGLNEDETKRLSIALMTELENRISARFYTPSFSKSASDVSGG